MYVSIRTAYYFGVDGVLLCSKNSASLTPAVSKVSSGAMELMDVYATRNLVKFLQVNTYISLPSLVIVPAQILIDQK